MPPPLRGREHNRRGAGGLWELKGREEHVFWVWRVHYNHEHTGGRGLWELKDGEEQGRLLSSGYGMATTVTNTQQLGLPVWDQRSK